ncbi:MAG: hypothetical protein EOM54_02795 [Clostridia bacterium]|nr:hypothetical protein [Clostridia bacterium]NCC68441.1 hypothetical protein [Clostridia bacterium]
MFVKILISALIAAAIIVGLWALRGFLLMPMKLGKNSSLTVKLRVDGPDPRLEQTLDGILWLRENGTLPADIVIEDCGMDTETREVARIAAKSRAGVSLCRRGEV